MRASANLPPLAALRAFEAAGRLLSFRKAGEELLITQSAVNHHIRQLEEFLGAPLFLRHARSVSLTPEGEAYLAEVAQAFGLLIQATGRLRRRRVVRVSLTPSRRTGWSPALGAFRRCILRSGLSWIRPLSLRDSMRTRRISPSAMVGAAGKGWRRGFLRRSV